MEPMLHSFGGSHLDRHIFDFDTDDGIGDGGLIPAADPAGDVDPPAWSYTQDEHQALVGRLEEMSGAVGYLARLEQQRAQVYAPPAPDGQQIRLDPLADDFHDQLERYLDQRTQPYEQQLRAERTAEANERIEDMLTDLKSSGEEFDTQMARMRVNQLAFELAPRFGGDLWKATQAACELAATHQREYEAKLRDDAIARHTNQLRTLAGAPGEAGTRYAIGTQTREVPDYRQGGSVADRFFAAQQ